MKNLKNVMILIILAGLLFTQSDISHSHNNHSESETCIPATGEPITLGAIFPQGSLFSSRSGDSYQGAEAMRITINKCGGVDGVPIEWAYEPASDRTSTETAAQKLVGQGVPLIIGSGLNVVSSAASRIAESAGVVYWETSEAPSVRGDWIFSLTANATQLGTAAANFAQSNFESPRVALIYEKRDEQIAAGIRMALDQPPLIEHTYSSELCCGDAYTLAVEMREARINVVILSVFDRDGERLWYALREADANIAAWIHVGSEGYRRDICQSANSEGFISINTAGPVSASYRAERIGEIDRLYRAAYRSAYGSAPSATADLSASGVYLLLKYVLPSITGEINAESIREAARAFDLRDPVGLMGESMSFDAAGVNQSPAVIARQQQGRAFCSVWPESVATCSGLLEFPTWRERALALENRMSCSGEM